MPAVTSPARRLRRRVRRSRWNPFGTLVRVDTSEPVVALTFDDGPDPRYTPRLLETLEQHEARATFFMIGEAAQRRPDLVRAAAEGGHCVANHTHTHPSLPSLPGSSRREEIRRCAEALGPHGDRLFRPPKGHQTVATRLDLVWCRHRPVAWSVAVDDWKPHDADWLLSRLEEEIGPGEIVLLHDGLWDPDSEAAADRGPVVEAVRRLLERRDGMYRFVTVPDLLDHGAAVRVSWFNRPEDDGGGADR